VKSGLWRAKIKVRGKTIHLGTFDDEVEAALAYDKAAREHKADQAVLNFPSGVEEEEVRCGPVELSAPQAVRR
jgi:hypothetical protein